MLIFAAVILFFLIVAIILIIVFRPKVDDSLLRLFEQIGSLQSGLKEDFRISREESSGSAKETRSELQEVFKEFKSEMREAEKNASDQNQKSLEQINRTIEEKITALINKVEENNKINRESMSATLKEFTLEMSTRFGDLKTEQKELTASIAAELKQISDKIEKKLSALNDQAKGDNNQMRDTLTKTFGEFGQAFDKSIASFNDLQKEKFSQLEEKQGKLIENTEKKLEDIRTTVDEKLQKTLSERIGQSFELVGKQLENVQKGLGEMQTLAQDVGGLKKVLSNVKMRGGFGEVQLSLLLEQILAPDQYEANVKIKSNSSERVEFAIKLPGKDDNNSIVWIPIDAKFPKDVYEQLQTAYELSDIPQIETAQKNLENIIKRMAKDINEKYIDPPNTTDFAIMFLPFEGIYGEVVRKASLLEALQRQYKVVVTGPTTLAAILNSLQMGFRSLAIQRRSSEVWQILGSVKQEFSVFGGLLGKAQNNIQTGLNQLDDVLGKRTRAIQRKLKGVEALAEPETLVRIEVITDEELDNEEPNDAEILTS